jgi:hypothetical protein
MNVGLLYTPVSIYQMTRGALVLFVGVLSVLFLRRRLWLYQFSNSIHNLLFEDLPLYSQMDLSHNCNGRHRFGRFQWLSHQGCHQGVPFPG